MSDFEEQPRKPKALRKITKQRLKNVGLYYLKRFESSEDNLRQVLRRRVNDYAYYNPDFNKTEAYGWIEEVLSDFTGWKYIDDERYTSLKVRDYLNAGKPERYIKTKLKQKGVDENIIAEVLSKQEYDSKEMALNFAKKKKIGPFRPDEESRKLNRQKDMGTLIRAGFDYDTAAEVLGEELFGGEY